MNTCTIVSRPLCRPTPFVGYAETARWVNLTYCQIISLKGFMASEVESLLAGKHRLAASFPLDVQQCLRLIETIDGQLPELHPQNCCIELMVRFTESELYQINAWRVWTENWLADQMERIPLDSREGQIAMGKVEELYKRLTEIRMRLIRKDASA